MGSMPEITNIAAYQFAPLTNLQEQRGSLRTFCQAQGLKGTILLSTEGINLFVAGEATAIDRLLGKLRAIPGLEGLRAKISLSEQQPFRRMLVRIKKEIIAFGVEGIDPGRHTSPKIAPATLKQWLDEGRPLTLLDTRNEYEIKLGTFRGAKDLGIQHFRQFPEASRQLPEELKERPVVMFCTGGIRCEKAGPFLETQGFQQILQLDGGILKYFEDCGSAHYEGECFVFDQRVGVDPQLAETASTQCFRCQTPLSAADQESPYYAVGQSCPHCYNPPELLQAERLARRHEAIRSFTDPLPGSTPQDNRRPIQVPRAYDGASLLDFLCGIFGYIPKEDLRALCDQGRLLCKEQAVPAEHLVRAGERYVNVRPGWREPDVSSDIRIVHEDEAIIVVEKPAPLPMHPCGRYQRNTLQHILNAVYHPEKPRPCHRLDANTTGLVVFARTRHFAGRMQAGFIKGEQKKVYLARTIGHPPEREFRCDAAVSTEPGELGSRRPQEDGSPAVTEFVVRERFDDGTSLLEARPITGRTNQIRVHLWQLAWPIVGERAYLPDHKLGDTQTLALGDPPLCLHAWKLAFRHPLNGEWVGFESTPPRWTVSDSL